MGDGFRTRDIQIHILVLYLLSYTHRALHLVGSTMPKPAGIVKGRPELFREVSYPDGPVRPRGGTIAMGVPQLPQAEESDPAETRPSRAIR